MLRKPVPKPDDKGQDETNRELLARLADLHTDQLVQLLRSLEPEMLKVALEFPSDAPGNGRRAKRSRTLRSAKIIYNNRASVADCQIRDISDTGCRARVASTSGIPRFFSLHILAGDTKHECEVVWRTADELGIKYLA